MRPEAEKARTERTAQAAALAARLHDARDIEAGSEVIRKLMERCKMALEIHRPGDRDKLIGARRVPENILPAPEVGR